MKKPILPSWSRLCCLVLGALGTRAHADPPAYPAWWTARGVLQSAPAADFAILNQGQLKNLAVAAYDQFEATPNLGAGPIVTAMVKAWFETDLAGNFILDSSQRRIPKVAGVENHAGANIGQLKAIARAFYERLFDQLLLDPTTESLAWWDSQLPPADFALANLGQAKHLFRWKLGMDTDGDGIADSAEDHDRDGLTVAQENSLGTSPSSQDSDNDGIGDGAEDNDGDGIANAVELELGLNPLADDSMQDADGDGLTNSEEALVTRTDPFNWDSDNDTLSDGDEVNLYSTNPLLADSDRDGLSDSEELALGLNPMDADEDANDNEIADAWEVIHGFWPAGASGFADSDSDGLVDLEEYRHGTNPWLWDTDGDGIPDGFEVQYWQVLSPLDPLDAFQDPDDDRVTNLEEYVYGGIPNAPDLDENEWYYTYNTVPNDGLPNLWENVYQFDANYTNNAGEDADGDGLTNIMEFLLRTHPRVADTDGDGIPDGWEHEYGLNPLSGADANEMTVGEMTFLQLFAAGGHVAPVNAASTTGVPIIEFVYSTEDTYITPEVERGAQGQEYGSLNTGSEAACEVANLTAPVVHNVFGRETYILLRTRNPDSTPLLDPFRKNGVTVTHQPGRITKPAGAGLPDVKLMQITQTVQNQLPKFKAYPSVPHFPYKRVNGSPATAPLYEYSHTLAKVTFNKPGCYELQFKASLNRNTTVDDRFLKVRVLVYRVLDRVEITQPVGTRDPIFSGTEQKSYAAWVSSAPASSRLDRTGTIEMNVGQIRAFGTVFQDQFQYVIDPTQRPGTGFATGYNTVIWSAYNGTISGSQFSAGALVAPENGPGTIVAQTWYFERMFDLPDPKDWFGFAGRPQRAEYKVKVIATPLLDTNQNGMNDDLEFKLFGIVSADPDYDLDGDTLSLAEERARGTSPFRADTDGDGANDNVDAYPLDPTRKVFNTDFGTGAPVIVGIIAPAGADQISVNPAP